MATIDRHGSTLTVVEFDQIADLTFDRDELFFTDLQITLELKDGRPISFPVSSEVNRDEKFFETIQKRVEETGGGGFVVMVAHAEFEIRN